MAVVSAEGKAANCDAATDGPCAELARAKALWTSHALSNYKYKMREGGVFGGSDITVVVRSGRCVKAYSWRHLRKQQESCAGRTIEEWFDEIRLEIEADPDSLTASYDPTRGFPRHFEVTPSGLVDQEWYFDVRYLSPLD
jgi:Family of unknown function (DUF6174)